MFSLNGKRSLAYFRVKFFQMTACLYNSYNSSFNAFCLIVTAQQSPFNVSIKFIRLGL
jgi:hypothetical protein